MDVSRARYEGSVWLARLSYEQESLFAAMEVRMMIAQPRFASNRDELLLEAQRHLDSAHYYGELATQSMIEHANQRGDSANHQKYRGPFA